MIIYLVESRRRRHQQVNTIASTRKLGEQSGLDTRVVQAVNKVYRYSIGYLIDHLMMWGQPFKSKQLAAVEMRGGTCGLNRFYAIHLTTFYIYSYTLLGPT